MKKLKAIIIDDESPSIRNIQLLLQSYCPEVMVVGTATTIVQATQLIKQEQPDLIFLDILMPSEGTGFDLLSLFPNREFHVIFITAYEEYGIQAVKEHAFDYLLKPVDYRELTKTIQKLTHKIQQKKETHSPQNSIITLATEGEIHLVSENHILYCKAEGSYTQFHLEEQKTILYSRHLKHVEGLLNNNIFYRCHRSYIINTSKVTKIIKQDGGYVEIRKQLIPVGKQHSQKILSLF